MFITLEGGEGSGKSSVARELAKRLTADRRKITVTEEPTGTELGRHIWRFFHEAGPQVDPLAELLLFEAARAQHVAEVIRPALERAEIVISDRFMDSSIAYQGYARDLGPDFVALLNSIATGRLTPDLTLLLDLPVEIGLRRAHARSGDTDDSIGAEPTPFHQLVREGFLALAKTEPKRFVIIDASQPLDAVVDACWDAIRGRLG